MDSLDNKTILKVTAVVVVAYLMYRVYVSRNENFSNGLQYSQLSTAEQNDSVRPPTYMPPMSVASDLLPKPVQGLEDFSEFAPTGDLQGMNFLDPSAMIGVNTQGSSRRNPNLQLRADPICPKTGPPPAPVSDIDRDHWRKPLDDCY